MNSRFKYLIVTMSTLLVAFLLFGAVSSGNNSSNSDDQYRHLGVYTEVLSKIKSDYVEEPDLKSVTLGALNGLLESIDPYASYLNADQYKQYLKQKDLKKADVGLVLAKRFGYVGVVDAVPGSPADKASLNTGDVIESINNVSTRDMPLAYADILLRGDPGTTVELGVLRFGKPDPQKLTLTRANVQAPPVSAKMMPDQVGYVRPYTVEAARVHEVRTRIQELERQGAKKFVLDLRDSSTGPPEEGVRLANLFVDKGLLAYTLGQKYPRQDLDAQAAQTICRLPLVVITNRGTAGGAEVAAAALQDAKRAEVVGERTYGDAAIRKAVTMDDGSAVILSVAKFYSPSGKAIQDNGVTPTVQVAEVQPTVEDEDENAPEKAPETTKPSDDQLLKKAVDVLMGRDTASTQPGAHPDGQLRPPGDDTPLHVPQPNR
jgi:carboxyl-terminal processing protease